MLTGTSYLTRARLTLNLNGRLLLALPVTNFLPRLQPRGPLGTRIMALSSKSIALFEAKYNYQFWRPVTAIELAGDDGNPNTNPNVCWLPLPTQTAPDPSYPGAHSTISFAGAEVLKFYFGDRFTFDVTSELLH